MAVTAQEIQLQFQDQTSDGSSVTVAQADAGTFPVYYVVIWSTSESGDLDQVLGYQQVTESPAENVEVNLDQQIARSQTLAATVAPDNDGNPNTENDPDTEDVITRSNAFVTVESNQTPNVTFDDQTTNGSSVTVASASNTSSPFYVNVWTINETTGEPVTLEGQTKVIGTSAEDVVVETPKGLNESQTLLAVVQPDQDGDPATTDPDHGTILASDTANVTVETEAAVTIDNQTSDGGSVVVASATNTSAPFYVGVWSTDQSGGNAVGRQTLLGTVQVNGTSAESVTVPFTTPIAESGTVVAVVYSDTDGNASTTNDADLTRIFASDTANVTVQAGAETRRGDPRTAQFGAVTPHARAARLCPASP